MKNIFRKGWLCYYSTFIFLGAGITLLVSNDLLLAVAIYFLYISHEMYFSHEFDCYVLGEEQAEKNWL